MDKQTNNNIATQEDKTHKAKILIEALPYIKQFKGKTIVIKYGGAAQNSPQLERQFAKDIVLLNLIGIKTVIVHGGGNKINAMLEKLNIQSEFVDGVRVTCKESMEVVQMVLGGEINKNLSDMLNSFGAKAVGLSGKDGIAKAVSKDAKSFKYTGKITKISNKIIKKMLKENIIPVIAPLASSSTLDNKDEMNNKDYCNLGFNINADVFATHLATSLKAEKIFFLTDTTGVLDKNGELLDTLDIEQTKELIEEATIHGGMIPKVNSCLYAINNGVTKAHIINGALEHGIILELLTNKGSGTQFIKSKKANWCNF